MRCQRICDTERFDPSAANLEAVRRIEKWLYASIEAHQTVGDAWLFDNSYAKPQLIGTKSKGQVKLTSAALQEIQKAAKLVGAN